MDIKLKDIINVVTVHKAEPDELKLRELRAEAELKYRFDQRLPEDQVVFSAQVLTTIASNYHKVETFCGVPS